MGKETMAPSCRASMSGTELSLCSMVLSEDFCSTAKAGRTGSLVETSRRSSLKPKMPAVTRLRRSNSEMRRQVRSNSLPTTSGSPSSTFKGPETTLTRSHSLCRNPAASGKTARPNIVVVRRSDERSASRTGKSLSFHPSVLFWNDVQLGEFVEVRRLLEGALSRRRESDATSANDLELNRSNRDGITALHLCCFGGAAECVGLLMRAGAFVNAADKDGWTPAHAAAVRGYDNILHSLSTAGADLELRDFLGRSPLDVAADDRTRQVLLHLMQFGDRSTAV